MKVFLLFAAMAVATGSAGAQNLVQNPNFDTGAAGWELSPFAAWSDRVDHNNSPFSGAMQITTRDLDSAQQCIEVHGSTKYAISVWVEKDPQASISPCASPNHFIQVEFYDAAQCGGDATSSFGSVQSLLEPDGWQHFTSAFTTQQTTQSALLSLDGECRSTGTGISIHYFDDILIVADEILQADFEPQDQAPSS